ncbi:MAG TPA: hypothetical protein VES39_04495, partial [Rhodospirillales bacterium]|nr:hypothetical protein [Rhodospirillales bacterium]
TIEALRGQVAALVERVESIQLEMQTLRVSVAPIDGTASAAAEETTSAAAPSTAGVIAVERARH